MTVGLVHFNSRSTVVSDDEDAELLQVFLDEAREHLGGVEGDRERRGVTYYELP